MTDVLRIKEGVVKIVLTTGTEEGYSLLDLMNNKEFYHGLVVLFNKHNIHISDVDFKGEEEVVYSDFISPNPLLN